MNTHEETNPHILTTEKTSCVIELIPFVHIKLSESNEHLRTKSLLSCKLGAAVKMFKALSSNLSKM